MDTIDHAPAALARLAQYLRGQPNAKAIIEALCASAQDVETAFQALATDRAIATAADIHLDNIGDIIGQPRGGLSDSDYRLYLRARIQSNLSSGNVEDIITAIHLSLGDDTHLLTIKEEFPAALTFVITEAVTPAQALAALVFLRSSKAGGVRAILEWTEAADADTFTLDGTDDQALDEGELSGGLV